MITKLQVKYIQSLGQKKFRDEAGLFVAEGPKIVCEWLSSGAVEMLYATHKWIDQHATEAAALGDKITALHDTELDRISFLQTPNEVLGIFRKPVAATVNFSQTVSLMLDGIQDPGNMGTIVRIADWFGVKQIVCSNDCADAFAPKAVQAAMGSVMRVQLQYTDLVAKAAETKTPLYAATLNGEKLNNMQPLREAVLVIGNESKGISPSLLAFCHHRITIPRAGKAESLNAAVATGIILSHLTA